MKTSTEKMNSFPFTVIFFEALKKMKNGYIANIYHHIFKLIKPEDLEWNLKYIFELSEGKDDYFKKYGKEEWFAIFHKSIRQTDFIQDCYQKRKMDLLTDDEQKEFRFLANKCREKDYDKTKDKKGDQLFNDEYNRFLDLSGRKRREIEEVSIGGHLDSILWNMIWVDENELYDAFLSMFSEYKLQKQLEKPKKTKKVEKVQE